MQRINMKKLMKVPAVAAVVLTLATAGVSNARAGGWPVAAGVVGGFAVGAMVGRTVAYCPPPACYVYPPKGLCRALLRPGSRDRGAGASLLRACARWFILTIIRGFGWAYLRRVRISSPLVADERFERFQTAEAERGSPGRLDESRLRRRR